jgi:hypothetical protein
MSNGGTANNRGRMFERAVGELLEETYQKVSAKKFFPMIPIGQPIFASQCQATTDVYGKKRRVDYILFHPRRWQSCLVIQCKWQASSGSVEEKYPFEVMSIEANGYPTIIAHDGGGYSAGAEEWLRAQAGKGNLLHVFTLGELNRFASRGEL